MKPSHFFLIAIFLSLDTLAQSVPPSTGSKISQAEAQEALDFHNKARKDVGPEPLQWSSEVAAYAQSWADSLALRNCAFEHRQGSSRLRSYGENIYWSSGSSIALNASRSWYSEISKYTYGTLTSENWSVSGHYTQMVWADSKRLGIGKATCRNGATIIVANYDPPGNYMGEKPY
jgi:pathogenesis-related protein 1